MPRRENFRCFKAKVEANKTTSGNVFNIDLLFNYCICVRWWWLGCYGPEGQKVELKNGLTLYFFLMLQSFSRKHSYCKVMETLFFTRLANDLSFQRGHIEWHLMLTIFVVRLLIPLVPSQFFLSVFFFQEVFFFVLPQY